MSALARIANDVSPHDKAADIASRSGCREIAARKPPPSVEIAHTPQTKFIKIKCSGPRQGMANGKNASSSCFDVIDGDMEQYVERAGARSRSQGRLIREAVASMMMDMRKHPNCGASRIHAIGSAAAAGDAAVARACIEGFN